MTQPLNSLVHHVAQLLEQSRTRIVFAESCTAGLVSASLARVPGISEFHCGSAVVYRLDTKTKWLDVSAELLRDVGAVSDPVARSMAMGVLHRTPEAGLSAAITGLLGPNAPTDQDGLVFIAIARRISSSQIEVLDVHRHVIPAPTPVPTEEGANSLREWRQWRGTELVLSHVRDELLRSLVPAGSSA